MQTNNVDKSDEKPVNSNTVSKFEKIFSIIIFDRTDDIKNNEIHIVTVSTIHNVIYFFTVGPPKYISDILLDTLYYNYKANINKNVV